MTEHAPEPGTSHCAMHIHRYRPFVRALAIGLAVSGPAASILSKSAFGQTVRDTAPPTSQGAARPPPALPAPSEEVLKLSPYAVQETTDDSYGALNSNSITEFNTALNKLPISADVFSQSFMEDVGAAAGIEQMISTYSAGAGIATATPDASASSGSEQPGDRNNNTYIQLRGLATPAMQRDGLMTVGGFFQGPGSAGVGFSPNFDVERVEIINGPQSLLYGPGGGGGVINTVSKQARFGRPASGSIKFSVDQHGNKLGQADYGTGTDKVAARLALLRQQVGGRRVDIGGPLAGYYGQFAFRLTGNTLLRLTGQLTTFDRTYPRNLILTAVNAANDARHQEGLTYLLATNQIERAAAGPSGAGVIANGHLNWDNVNSLVGSQAREYTENFYSSAAFETKWNETLSTKIQAGYDGYLGDLTFNGMTFYAPNHTANPLRQWTVAEAGGLPMGETLVRSRQKALRFSALMTHALFGGRAHSRTNVGADYLRGVANQENLAYFLADANWNPIVGTGAVNGGRTRLPAVFWSIQNGRVKYPLWRVGIDRVTREGANYIQAPINPRDEARVSPSNPLGTTLAGIGGGGRVQAKFLHRGIFGVNQTSWLDDRLDTLLGFRVISSVKESYFAADYLGSQPPSLESSITTANFSAGANYALRPWLRPYFAVSDSVNLPLMQNVDPFGVPVTNSRALGTEVGVKLQNQSGRISGSLSAYSSVSKNEQQLIPTPLLNNINPAGLNGRHNNPNSSGWINVKRESEGVMAVLTASPNKNWRLRVSGAAVTGTIGSTTTYRQAYNDQFYQNSQGQVTYADGSVVWVRPAFTAAQLTVPAGTAGAIPLTIAALSTPGNAYYANPQPVTGAIAANSTGGRVLDVVDPVHGSILTGATGLPISAIQINPGFTPPDTIVTSRAGEYTTGYPRYSMNMTSMYTFTSGWLKGLRAGGSVQFGWDLGKYYYHPQGITPDARRELFVYPDITSVNLIVGYTRDLGRRFRWSSQINVDNLFNTYEVVILPNPNTGFTGSRHASFDQQPRLLTFSHTISFR